LSQAVVDLDVASDRVLRLDDDFVTAVPHAPDWPFEVHVRARRDGVRRLADLTAAERTSLALALRTVVTAYDRAYDQPMAYLMTCHEAPAGPDGEPVADHRLAFEFMPPHRSATKLKVRASVETALGVFINDTLPEASAALLRAALPDPADTDRAGFPEVRILTDATAPTP
jgi:UDPglucose--hexose-1-phosphate uridylyltransferase